MQLFIEIQLNSKYFRQLYNNQLIGIIPTQLGNLTNLQQM